MHDYQEWIRKLNTVLTFINMSKTIFLVEDDQDDQEFFVEAVNKIENATLHPLPITGFLVHLCYCTCK